MKPVLLLIPGMLNDGRVWQGVADLLVADADLRIAEVSSQASIAAMREDAWALLADVAPATPLVIAGFSMGGYVALDMLAHPRRPVQGLLMMSSSAQPENEQSRAGREKSLAAIDKDYTRFVDTVLTWNTASTDPVLVDRLRRMMLDQGPATASRQVRAIMGREDHRALLQTLTLPVRILCGRLDKVTPPALSEALKEVFPQAGLDVIEGAGHMLPCERPEAVAQVLRELLTNS